MKGFIASTVISRALLAVVAGAGALAGAEQRGSVTSAGLPIPGAVVTAVMGDRRVVTSTDESGKYVFEDLTPGSWTLEVSTFGFETAIRVVEVPASAPAVWDLKLKAASAASPAPSAAARRPAAPQPFQRLGVTQMVQDETLAAMAAIPAAELQNTDLAQNANESFLVTGSLSRGLQAPREEMLMGMVMMGMAIGGFGPGGGPGGETSGSPGFGGGPAAEAGVPGVGGQAWPGGGGVGPGGMGGPGGPGAGPMGSGGPGGPGIRGPGGFGGREGMGGDRKQGGPGRPEWQNRPGAMIFGNRANRGRESFRGAAFFTLGNSALDARPYSLTGQTVNKPSYAQARFGLTGGGQLRIPKIINSDKTFVFLNYTGTRSRNPYSAVATLPSALERGGDFSRSIGPGPVAIYDFLNGQPFPGNRLPAFRINAAARGLLTFFPLPNQPGSLQNYQFVTSVPRNSHNLGVRVMHTLTRKDRIGGSFNLQDRDSSTAQLFQFIDTGAGRGLSANLSWTRNIRAGLINNLSYSFSRNRDEAVPYFAYGRNVAAELGIAGTSNLPVNYGPPNLSFTNFGALTDGSASLQRNQSSSISEGVTIVKGRHTWSTGGNYQRSQINSLSDQNGRGTFTFTGLMTSAFDANGQPLAGTGFDFADFLLGLPQSGSIRFGRADTYFRGSRYSAFVQDAWRVRPNLTLNTGLRYEFQTPLKEKYNRIANLDIAPGFTGVAVVTPGQTGPYSGRFSDTLIDPDRNNLAPRFGLAWKPFPKRSLIVRAGYGAYFNASVYNQAAMRLAQQPPFAARAATIITSLVRPLTLQDGFSAAPAAEITNTYAVDRNYKVGYAQTWNLAVQQELPLSLVLEVGYLGTKGTRLDIQRLPNRAPAGSPLTAEQRRQIGNATGFTFDSSEGNSIYHAAQVRLNRRFRRGLSANFFYTYSKSIDNASTFGGGGAVVVQDDKNLRAERGLSSFDQRHALTLNWVLASPVGTGPGTIVAHGWKGALAKDWTISGGVSARSGTPFTATVLGNRSDAGGTGAVGSSRADATGLPVSLSGQLFNPAAFALPAAGRYGNAGRNTIPGQFSVVVNMALGRSFRLGERRSVEFRMESNNTLNAMNVTRIGTTVNASNYGLALAAGQMRTMQASLRIRF